MSGPGRAGWLLEDSFEVHGRRCETWVYHGPQAIRLTVSGSAAHGYSAHVVMPRSGTIAGRWPLEDLRDAMEWAELSAGIGVDVGKILASAAAAPDDEPASGPAAAAELDDNPCCQHCPQPCPNKGIHIYPCTMPGCAP
jgi:hypothetical protein